MDWYRKYKGLIWRVTCQGCGYPFWAVTKHDPLCDKCRKKAR